MVRAERILIVGGGIAGLTAAIALRGRGFAPELVEQSASWRALGAGIALQPNAMQVLRSLDVGADIEKAGAPLRRFKYFNQGGDLLCEVDLVGLWSRMGLGGVGVGRDQLQKALVQAADGARCRLGVGLTSLRQCESFVSVSFSDGTTADYELVIGADGIGSTVGGEQRQAQILRADGVAKPGAGSGRGRRRGPVLARRGMFLRNLLGRRRTHIWKRVCRGAKPTARVDRRPSGAASQAVRVVRSPGSNFY